MPPLGERADQRAADGLEAARLRQRAAAHQDAAAGRPGGGPRRIGHPGEGVELLEKEDERRNQQPAPEIAPRLVAGALLQGHHEGDQVPPIGLGKGHQPPERAGVMADVGIGQQQPGGLTGRHPALQLQAAAGRAAQGGSARQARQGGGAVVAAAIVRLNPELAAVPAARTK